MTSRIAGIDEVEEGTPVVATKEGRGTARASGRPPRWIWWALLLGVTAVVATVALVRALGLYPRAPRPVEVLPASTSGAAVLDLRPELHQDRDVQAFVGAVPALKTWAATGRPGGVNCQLSGLAERLRPWIGREVAVASVPGESGAVWVVQVRDPEAARAGVRALAPCGVPQGVAQFTGGMVLAADDAAAQRVFQQGQDQPLSQEESFVEDSRRVSDAGVMTFWGRRSFFERVGSRSVVPFVADSGVGSRLLAEARRQDWRSAAGMVRFANGAPELKVAVKSNAHHHTSTSPVGISSLPQDTVLAIGISDGDEVVQDHGEVAQAFVRRVAPEAFKRTQAAGSTDPSDLASLLGSDAKVGWVSSPAAHDVAQLSPRILVGGRSGDWPERAVEAVGRLDPGASLKSSHRRRTVAFAPSADQAAAALRPDPSLEDDAVFKQAYPKPEQAQVGVYANLQALGPIAVNAAPPTLKPWVEALGAVGANAHNEDANYSVMRVAVTPRG